MTGYPTLFARARKIETLLLLVHRQVRELPHVRFNEAVQGYKAHAAYYREHGHPTAAALFEAAHARFLEIKPHGYEGTC